MKKILLSILLISFCAVLPQSAEAHAGVAHGTEEEATLHIMTTDEQMRTIIALLQKLVFLLERKRELSLPYVPVTPTVVTPSVPVTPVVPDVVVAPEPPAKKLVIEVEEHHGSTHVHVRYVDKPESMFFITIPLSDKDGIIREIATRIGLGESEVRDAVVYLRQ